MSRSRSLGLNDEQYPQGKFYVEEMMAAAAGSLIISMWEAYTCSETLFMY